MSAHLLPAQPGPFAPALRAAARAAFEAAGLPTRRTEDWKYTAAVRHLADTAWAFDGGRAPAALPEVAGAARLVFVNGRFAPALSAHLDLPAGVTVERLAEAPAHAAYGALAELEGHPFAALNTAAAVDGLQVVVGRNQQAPALHLVHVAAADADEAVLSCPRVLVVAEAGAQVKLIEEFVSHGAGRTAAAAVTEIQVGPNAQVEHTELFHQDPERAWHLGRVQVTVDRDGRFAHHHVSLGGALTRSEVRLKFLAPGGEFTANGLYASHGQQHHDHHAVIEHAVPRCTSDQTYKGLIGGAARGVFTGQVIVAPGAHHTRADQHNPNLLLTNSARIDTRPQLIIDNDDVLCSHGATTGQLDEAAVFYLMARGVPRAEAQRMLGQAFADEVLDKLPWPDVAERARAAVRRDLFGTELAEVAQ
ncbi:MAG: Fe-S cluster assembly protein SufD [Myxococcales bacterium]|nr:Fe-S cluster assembly protein SufD [Myxococcales bacterium]